MGPLVVEDGVRNYNPYQMAIYMGFTGVISPRNKWSEMDP